jgi:hypothetical protein
MRNLGLGAVAVTLVMVGTACSDSLAPESIAGAYMVSVWELTSVETPSKQEEWVAGGVNIRFEIGADGSFTITATWDETATVDVTGLTWQYSINGSTVTISLPPAPEASGLVPCSGPISRSGDTLTWTFPDCITRDFGGGTEEPAILRVVATRTS